jgi:hypothetical protein
MLTDFTLYGPGIGSRSNWCANIQKERTHLPLNPQFRV